ncbi:unnamed protein product [Acanthoscelides obtectus]|uniref:Uncharacterized protein n=1 Tax=Acanthoscelides obtectus TaxID=200917 RepID=A0A9P0MDY9_ACAOB|nr:unnamed protein product [Acanthoscelides obtectus]CAK1671575.1 hypothetical protein AOBTE_LOCUS28332 [Acanthoscelides obtectus]
MMTKHNTIHQLGTREERFGSERDPNFSVRTLEDETVVEVNLGHDSGMGPQKKEWRKLPGAQRKMVKATKLTDVS